VLLAAVYGSNQKCAGFFVVDHHWYYFFCTKMCWNSSAPT